MLVYHRAVTDGEVVHSVRNSRCIRNLCALALSLLLCAAADAAWWLYTRNLVLPLLLSGVMVALAAELRTVTSQETLSLQSNSLIMITTFLFKKPTVHHIPISALKSVLIYEALSAHSVRHCLGFIQANADGIQVAFASLAPPLSIVQPIYQELLENKAIWAQLQKCKDD